MICTPACDTIPHSQPNKMNLSLCCEIYSSEQLKGLLQTCNDRVNFIYNCALFILFIDQHELQKDHLHQLSNIVKNSCHHECFSLLVKCMSLPSQVRSILSHQRASFFVMMHSNVRTMVLQVHLSSSYIGSYFTLSTC